MKKSDPKVRKLKTSAPQYDILRSQKPRNLFLSGQGGGKTFIMGLLAHQLVKQCPKAIGLICANTYLQLSDSTLMEIFQVWKLLGWTEYSDNNPGGYYVIDKKPPDHFKPHGYTFKSNSNKLYFKDGQVVMLASLDNYKAIEGRTIGWSLLDETSDTKEIAVKEVITARLRQLEMFVNKGMTKLFKPFVEKDDPDAGDPVHPLYVFTKPAKEQWLTEFFSLEEHRSEILEHIFSKTDYFFKEFDNKCVVIASAWHNIDNLDEGYILNREKELTKDQAELYIYGSPFGKSGVEYYSRFDRNVHVKPGVEIIQHLPLHITFDFNVNPYMTGQVWQVDESRIPITAFCVKEYAMEAPANTIEDVCRAFKADFYSLLTKQGLFYYGDATGKNTLPIKELRDLYKIIERELQEFIFHTSRRLLRQNPRHRSIGSGTLGRREFINSLLAGAHDINIVIDESCKKTIQDFEFTKEDSNGAKHKEKALINGVRCEKYGHMSDAADAFLCYNFGEYAKELRS